MRRRLAQGKKLVRNLAGLVRLYRERPGGGKTFWIFGTPLHGNLGDRALVFGEEAFVRQYFPEHRLCKVPLEQADGLTYRALPGLVRRGDYCAIHAGGNIGTLYPGIHRAQERLIRALRRKSLFVFPQTVYSSEDAHGAQVLRRTREVYRGCRRLCLFVREEASLALLRAQIPELRSVLMPDMALCLPPYASSGPREGALLILRADGERTLPDSFRRRLLDGLEGRFSRVDRCDTHVGQDLTEEEARRELARLWRRMAGAQAVVTDRLHGMLFAALTQTPCVLLPSLSHKIQGVYQWVKPLPYIQFAGDEEQAEAALERVLSVPAPAFRLEQVEEAFDRLAGLIRELENG